MATRIWATILATTVMLSGSFTSRALADDDDDTEHVSNPSGEGKSSLFTPRGDPTRRRSDIFIPAVSFLLPGFDQWWEGQYGSAALYTGAAIGGTIYSREIAKANHILMSGETDADGDGKADKSPNDGDDKEPTLDSKGIAVRKVVLGGLVYQGAGGLSAYHSFRTAVRSRQSHGEYKFLKHEETPGDLLLAPFHFQYLARPSTFVPLGIGAAIMALVLNSDPGDKLERSKFTQADAFFTGAYSYNAGTHEEALFRGWVMPLMYEASASPFWSNAGQALLFAAAHLNTNPQPIPQLLLGYHLGNVTQNNGWRLGEAVFIHVWWDVLAFTSTFHFQQKEKEPEDTSWTRIRTVAPLTLWAPPVYFTF